MKGRIWTQLNKKNKSENLFILTKSSDLACYCYYINLRFDKYSYNESLKKKHHF